MKSNKKRKSFRRNIQENGSSSSKDIFEEFQLQEQESQTQFNNQNIYIRTNVLHTVLAKF